MSVIFTRPTMLIGDASENNLSNWVEVGNPVVYSWQYYDAVITQINNNGGFAQLQVTGLDVTAAFNTGNDAWVGINGYNDIFEITNVAFSGGNTLIDLDTPYNGSGTGYSYDLGNVGSFISDVDIYNSFTGRIIGVPLRGVAGNPGLITIDISAIVKAYLNPEIDIDIPNDTVFDDDNGYLGVYINYILTISSVPQSPVDDSANPIYCVLGARQIPSQYGGNLAEYVTFSDGDPAAKFLTRLDRPKIWRGFPFFISTIVGDLSSNALYSIVWLDENGSTISSAGSSNDHENQLILFNPEQVLAMPDNAVAARLNVFLDPTPQLTISLICDVVDPCEGDIMLLTRNSFGGVLQWVFNGSSDLNQDYKNDIKANRRTLFAENLSENEWNCLQDFIRLGDVYRNNIIEFTSSTIKSSSRIGHQVYTVDADGNKIGVIAIPTKNGTATRQKKHKFELEIEYPEEFVP